LYFYHADFIVRSINFLLLDRYHCMVGICQQQASKLLQHRLTSIVFGSVFLNEASKLERERESTPFIMLYFYFFFHSVWWELPHLPIVSFICISLYTENTLCILISSVIHQAKCIVDFVALVGHQKHLLNTLVV
jgi:hypothetical protein